MREFLNSFQKLEFPKVKTYLERYTVSDLARELIQNLAPSSDIVWIRQNLSLVSEMKKLLEADDPLPLDHLFDIRKSLHRVSIENFALSQEEFQRIKLVLRTSTKIRAYFTRRAGQYPLISSVAGGLTSQKVLEYNIDQAIDEEGHLKDSASKDLTAIRRQIADRNDSLRKSLEKILKSVAGKDWAQEDIITTREGRMVIPVKVEHKNHVPGFIHSASSSGATVFIEPMETLEMNNEIRTLRFAEEREIERILKALTVQVAGERENILRNVIVLTELDFIQAKAKYSIEVLGSEPVLTGRGDVVVRAAFHPILLHHHGRKEVIPLDMEFSRCNTLVITGPNAGGKSVAMKTVGLLSLLAQSGCHIPAAPESSLPVFDKIFLDSGDEQSIENDLSSFSSHLSNLRGILEEATGSSLVLIDEICSGTDPTEGFSLAAGILEQLAQTGSKTIVTTHHGTLKTFAFENPLMQNGSMEFDQETLRPTYRFRMGVPGSSYAIEMAQRMAIPEKIIERSKQLKGSDAAKLESLILDLERRAQELKRSLDEVMSEKTGLKSLVELYESKVSSLEKDLREIKSRAIGEAEGIIRRANSMIENSVREIRESSASREVVTRVKKEIQTLSKELETVKVEFQPGHEKHEEFKVGDVVSLKGSGAVGEVESVLDPDHYLVSMGGLRARVGRSDLLPAQKTKQTQKTFDMPVSEFKREIDLRGMYGDEALAAIDKFLDEALLAGLHRVDIIHGKGTGALRKKIAEFLKKTSSVKSFRLGEWNEGGSGVTVVELE